MSPEAAVLAHALAGAALLGCNAGFVMGEFAIVKLRDSQVAALALAGDPRAPLLRHIKDRMDEYLSVVQVGVTGATIGMGVVIDHGFGRATTGAFAALGWSGDLAEAASVATAFVLATGLTIVTGELVPKAVALRDTERVALLAARPLRLLHRLLRLPVLALNLSARGVLRLLGVSGPPREVHSEEEPA